MTTGVTVVTSNLMNGYVGDDHADATPLDEHTASLQMVHAVPLCPATYRANVDVLLVPGAQPEGAPDEPVPSMASPVPAPAVYGHK